jgi:hypothetical protein
MGTDCSGLDKSGIASASGLARKSGSSRSLKKWPTP